MGHKPLNCRAQLRGVVRRQVDFVTDAVKAKPDGFVRGSPIQIINKDDFYFLCH